MTTHHRTRLLLACLIGLICGCASTGPRNSERDPNTATVAVTNDSWSDVTVYARRGDARVLLGRVRAMQQGSFDLRLVSAKPVRIEVTPFPAVGGQVWTSGALSLVPGNTAHVTIGNQAGLNHAVVRNYASER